MTESLFVLAGIAVALYFAARLYLRQDSLIFRPRAATDRSPGLLGLDFEELSLKSRDNGAVHGWWVPGRVPGKAVIFFHGSDGNITYELPTLRYLQALAAGVLMVDYPGYGRSEGRASERGCYEAAELAWDFARERKGFSGEDLVLYGHSLGSAVATYLASSRSCAGVVFHSGFSSVPDMASAVYPYLFARYFVRTSMNSLARIAECRCPFLALHSEEDEHIPISQALKVYERAPGPKKFVRYHGPHRGHQWQAAPGVREALEELFGGRVEHWEQG
ncbi:MAG: alpha/beta fold hydrolase [Chloroflexota bacterium]|nr:alpha/beta fold hydrolase [Chloroflexota bacterium]